MAGRVSGGSQAAGRLGLYDDVAHRAAAVVVHRYSTSFGLATRLLPPLQRSRIADVYALVRLADEIVDGAAEEAGADPEQARDALDALERRTEAAMDQGYSTDLVVHAFGLTARATGITPDLTRPFFAAMRTDTERAVHDATSLATYIYGSAEVVGLMCLRVFLADAPPTAREARYAELAPGAQALGAAFQKVNFLRDLADDGTVLGRRYLVGLDPAHVTEQAKAAALADIRADLAVARAAMTHLPPGARRAVGLAYALFAELAARIEAVPAATLSTTRVRVPDPVKARLAAGVLVREGVRR